MVCCCVFCTLFSTPIPTQTPSVRAKALNSLAEFISTAATAAEPKSVSITRTMSAFNPIVEDDPMDVSSSSSSAADDNASNAGSPVRPSGVLFRADATLAALLRRSMAAA
jgi:hypothetical protein